MTFREKLKLEYQEKVDDKYIGGCCGCPCHYGYEGLDNGLCKGTWNFDESACRACWEREIPLTADGQEKHDLDNSQDQNTRRYCRDCTFRLHSPNKVPCNACESGSRWQEAPVIDADVEAVCKTLLTPEEQEAHNLEINAEIISRYCRQYDGQLCDQCPAFLVCGRGTGTWRANSQNPKCPTSAEKQRAMLDAFKTALPPEEKEAPTASYEIPQDVKKLVEARIKLLTEEIKVLGEQIKAREDERDTLCDYLRN